MTTQTMIEKVAEAVHLELRRQHRALFPWSRAKKNARIRKEALDVARAALQALREPTEEMERAAFDVLEVSPSPLFATGTLARNAVYTAMINAALQERP